jgi:hypothetical protein
MLMLLDSNKRKPSLSMMRMAKAMTCHEMIGRATDNIVVAGDEKDEST